MEGLSINLDNPSLNGSSQPYHPGIQGASWVGSPCSAGCQETRLQGLFQSWRDARSSKYTPVACGQWSDSQKGVSCLSQVAGCFPNYLQGHGGTRKLGHDVGQEVVGCPELPQVGHSMHHVAQEDEEEVHLGHDRVGSQEGLDEVQEQEGVHGLHVILVGSEAAVYVWISPAVLKASMSQGILRVGKSLLLQPHLAHDDCHHVHLDDQQCAAEQEGQEHLATFQSQERLTHLDGRSSGEDTSCF